MEKNNTIATINNNSTSLLEAIAPAPTKKNNPMEVASEARGTLFAVYPEICEVYNTICGGNPYVTFDAKWLTNSMGVKLAGFINIINFLEVDEIFPNFQAIKEAAGITDGGTINKKLEEIVSYLGYAAGKLACDKDNDLNLCKDYRRLAEWFIDRNNLDILNDESCGTIQSCCKFCNIDMQRLIDAVKTEISLRTFLIK